MISYNYFYTFTPYSYRTRRIQHPVSENIREIKTRGFYRYSKSSLGGLGSSDLVSPTPQRLSGLGKEGGCERYSDEDQGLVDSVSQSELSPDSWICVSCSHADCRCQISYMLQPWSPSPQLSPQLLLFPWPLQPRLLCWARSPPTSSERVSG
jgi:hypothetical protein